jgi:hypothetical protein
MQINPKINLPFFILFYFMNTIVWPQQFNSLSRFDFKFYQHPIGFPYDYVDIHGI